MKIRMKISLNDVAACSDYEGRYLFVYQGRPIEIDRDTYLKVMEANDQFNKWLDPIQGKILELQKEIYNYPPIEIEVINE